MRIQLFVFVRRVPVGIYPQHVFLKAVLFPIFDRYFLRKPQRYRASCVPYRRSLLLFWRKQAPPWRRWPLPPPIKCGRRAVPRVRIFYGERGADCHGLRNLFVRAERPHALIVTGYGRLGGVCDCRSCSYYKNGCNKKGARRRAEGDCNHGIIDMVMDFEVGLDPVAASTVNVWFPAVTVT